jgi:hypothetical protein
MGPGYERPKEGAIGNVPPLGAGIEPGQICGAYSGEKRWSRKGHFSG